MPTAVAYLRRSRVDTRRPGALSHEQQLEKIRELAARHGDEDLVVIEDWGKSGREEKTHLRTGFARLERMITAGEATAVYAYDLSRLGRSLVTVDRLATACADRGIPIRCADGFSPDVSNAQGQLVLHILSAIAQFYARSTKERMQDITMMRRQRGDRIGKAPYGQRVRGGKLEPNPDEDLAVVAAAYDRAGGVQAACRLLNAEGVRTRGGGLWRSSTLAQVLEAAGKLERRPRAGRPTSRTFLLSGLLRCPCGATLTGEVTNGGRNVMYTCKRARLDASHPRPASISELRVLPRVRELVDALVEELRRREGDRVPLPGAVVDRSELEGLRRRSIDLYKTGVIDRAEMDADLASIEAQLAASPAPPAVADLPSIDWTWPAADVNRLLRLVAGHVVLDEHLQPSGVDWRGRIGEWAL